MPDTGWVSPSAHDAGYTHTSVTNWGIIANPQNSYDGDYSTEALPSGSDQKTGGGASFGLHLYGFGFDSLLPEGAEISGIEIRWGSRTPFAAKFDPFMWFHIPGVEEEQGTVPYQDRELTSSDQASVYYKYSNEVSQTNLVTYTIGNSTSIWHPSITAEKVRLPLFGVVTVFLCQTYVEQGFAELFLKIHYAGGDPMSVRDGGAWKTASPHVKDGGIWKPAIPHVKDGGIWKAS